MTNRAAAPSGARTPTEARTPTARRTWRRVLAAGILLCSAVVGSGCGRGEAERLAAGMTGGDPARGPEALRRYGCQSCHTIPGVSGAHGLVGPPLTRIGSRSYIAGELPNTPENLMRWIQHPRELNPRTAMPDTGVTEDDVRHIAAYLYTLR